MGFTPKMWVYLSNTAINCGAGGAASGTVQANVAQATLGNARANPVFTSAQPGERAAATNATFLAGTSNLL